jgi:RNA polymerase sigma factor (sigma-70 family)
MLHHHHPHYIAATEADRRARAPKRRHPAEAGELERLMQAAGRGEHASWTALVERFTARVRAVARTHRLSAHDVDDVIQTTWLRLLEHIESVREPAALGAWLDTTARRESLRVIRDARRVCPTDEDLRGDEPGGPTGEHELLEAEQRAILSAGVERLPATQRRLIAALLAEPPRSYAEISKALDTPTGSIGPTRARSLARLRRDPLLVRAIGQEG